MSARGFTMLEVVVASTLGAALVLVLMALFGAMSRTDRLTQIQQEQVDAMQRLQVVMDRTFGTMVMSSVDGGGTSAGAAAADDAPSASDRDDPLPARARVLLEPDSRVDTRALPWGVIGPDKRPTTPQRLEVVLSRAPVPPGWVDGIAGRAGAGTEQEGDTLVVAVRGVFELRPDAASELTAPRDETTAGWTLWWRPLPPNTDREDGVRYELDPTEDPRAVPIASGLAGVQWTAFKQRERGSSLSATTLNDLPGYMEMQVRTTAGHYANWMFELSWTFGAEESSEDAGEEETGGGTDAEGVLIEGGGAGGRGGVGDRGGRGGAGGRDMGGGGR